MALGALLTFIAIAMQLPLECCGNHGRHFLHFDVYTPGSEDIQGKGN